MIQNLTIPKLGELARLVNSHFQTAWKQKKRRYNPPSIAIAGGAVRDLLHNRPIKDIDIFCYCEDDKTWALAGDTIADALYGEAKFSGDPDYGENAFSLCDIPTGLHMHPVQLVQIGDEPLDHIKATFDFGLSCCYIDGGGNLHCLPQYWKDHFDQKIRYIGHRGGKQPDPYQVESSRKRLLRLREKYPSWRFEYPSFLETLDFEPLKLEVATSLENLL